MTFPTRMETASNYMLNGFGNVGSKAGSRTNASPAGSNALSFADASSFDSFSGFNAGVTSSSKNRQPWITADSASTATGLGRGKSALDMESASFALPNGKTGSKTSVDGLSGEHGLFSAKGKSTSAVDGRLDTGSTSEITGKNTAAGKTTTSSVGEHGNSTSNATGSGISKGHESSLDLHLSSNGLSTLPIDPSDTANNVNGHLRGNAAIDASTTSNAMHGLKANGSTDVSAISGPGGSFSVSGGSGSANWI